MYDLSLDKNQEALFNEHLRLTRFVVAIAKQKYPFVDTAELAAVARIGLLVAVKRFDASRGIPFAPYARTRVKWSVNHHLFGRRAGAAAYHGARRHEISANAEVSTGDGEVIDLGTIAEVKLAKRLQNASVPDLRELGLLADVREGMKRCKLTALERRLLTLRYSKGMDRRAIAQRLGFSLPTYKRILRSGIGKLRTHFADRGALPADAKLPADGNKNGCNWKKRLRRAQLDCRQTSGIRSQNRRSSTSH